MIKDQTISKYGRVTTNTTFLKESVIKNCTGKQSYHCETSQASDAKAEYAFMLFGNWPIRGDIELRGEVTSSPGGEVK